MILLKLIMGIKKNFLLLLLLIAAAFIIRAINLSFPAFTSDEARIAYRGYTLATTGTDELGRKLPVVFNSLTDYQLPAVSYFTAGGQLIFGKSEFGARMPFLVLGTVLAFLIYQISKNFDQSFFFRLTTAFIVVFSPVLIFLSKVPNETILLTFIFALLFYLLLNKRNLVFIIITMILSVLTSKNAWLILFPFTLFTVIFYQRSLERKKKFVMIGLSALIVFSAFTLFLSIPQSKRSLMENNFSIFSDITIKNGIDKLRGQGMESAWPPLVDRLLFNKSHFLITGSLHWLSHLNPAIYFGQFDNSGRLNYSYLGAWPKVLIIPFFTGLFFLIKAGDRKKKLLTVYFLILTYPSIFIYPNLSLELIALTLPFMALVLTFGFVELKKKITIIILILAIMELGINIFNLTPDYKNTNTLRPTWIGQLTDNAFEKSKVNKVAISDDIVADIVPYIEWYSPFNPKAGFLQVDSPYKFRQYSLANIKIIGSDESFNTCGKNERVKIFVSIRDLNKIRRQFDIKIIDSYAEDKALLGEGACIK